MDSTEKKLTEESNKVFFPNLDCLRFLAFLAVFNRHTLINDLKPILDHGGILSPVIYFFCNGKLGVSFFFVLSGFLITYLVESEIKKTGKFDLKAFYVRRALRIWPLFYMVVFIGFVGLPLISHFLHGSNNVYYNPWYYVFFLSNFDYIHVMHGIDLEDYTVLNITWSVSIEEQFYIVYALIIYFLPRKFFQYYLLAMIAISTAFRYFNSNDYPVLYFHSFSVMSDLAIGGLSAWAVFNIQRFRNRIVAIPKYLITVILLVGFFFCIFIENRPVDPAYGIFFRLITALFFAFIILEQNYSVNSLFKLGRLKLLSKWGKITYGLYLLHPTVLYIVAYFRLKYFISQNVFLNLAFTIISFALCIAVCTFSYKYYEKPFLRLKEKFSR